MKKTIKAVCLAIAGAMALGLCACGENTAQVPEGYMTELENGLMFDEAEFAQLYNYCPSILVEGDNAYVWYCSNVTPGIGGDDHIAFRKGVNVNGSWCWGEKQIVAGPTEGTYYSGNICDPDVIRGEFAYKGETYHYLMECLAVRRRTTVRICSALW